jgi:hypothetical protein
MSSGIDLVYQTNILYEKEVQDYLASNLQLLGEPNLKLVAVEHPVKFGRDVGRIDILAKDASGSYVVIEVKRGVAGRAAIGQLQSYMGSISEDYPDSHVRGILVSMGVDAAASAALKMTLDIDLFEFKTNFQFLQIAPTRETRTKEKVIRSETARAEFRPDYWGNLGGTVLLEAAKCSKCGKFTRLVKVGPQTVCGLCGSPK